jgi:hypothetical protein
MGDAFIVCGKLDNFISFGLKEPRRLSVTRRIASDNPNKVKKVAYLPISTNGNQVLHQGGISDAEDFLDEMSGFEGRRLIVLTRKEYLLILEKISLRDIRVSVFEIDYRIFTDVRFNPSLRVNFDILNRLLRKIDSLGIISGSFAKDQSLRNLHSVARKLRFKNSLDRNFFFAYKDGYQEVFILKEERSDRAIIALDFNSMFADCMKGEYCEPRSIRYRSFADDDAVPDKLEEGIYRVVLHGAKDGFFLEKHPFLYKRLGKSYRFRLNPGDSVEIVLFKNEIEYYGAFFREVEVKEGFSSSKTVAHPLLAKANGLYEKRRYYRLRGDAVMENYCKMSLQMMHSSTNRRIFKRKRFDSLRGALDFLSSEFQLNFDEGSGLSDYHRFFHNNKYFSLKNSGGSLVLTYLDIEADSLLFSLSAKIVANARIKVIKTIERLLGHRSVEICYSNVDSIHISLEMDEVENFIERHRDLISDDIGCLKIQAIADQGYWFDVGRYWLKKDGKVVLFKNMKFNYKGASSEFVRKRKIFVLSKSAAFSHVGYRFANLVNSFSYSKRVKADLTGASVGFERYLFPEVESAEAADITEAEELMKSKKLKADLFQRISQGGQAKNLSDSIGGRE